MFFEEDPECIPIYLKRITFYWALKAKRNATHFLFWIDEHFKIDAETFSWCAHATSSFSRIEKFYFCLCIVVVVNKYVYSELVCATQSGI